MWRNGQAWPLTHHCPSELGRWEQAVSKMGPEQQSLPQFTTFSREMQGETSWDSVMGCPKGVLSTPEPVGGWKSCQKGMWSRVLSPQGLLPRYPFAQPWFDAGNDEAWDGSGELLASVLSYVKNQGDLADLDHQWLEASLQGQCVYLGAHLQG